MSRGTPDLRHYDRLSKPPPMIRAGVGGVYEHSGVHLVSGYLSASGCENRPSHPFQHVRHGRYVLRVIVISDRVGDDERPLRVAVAGTVRHDQHAAMPSDDRLTYQFGAALHPNQHACLRPLHYGSEVR
jgi:hypothetical protein